MTSKNWASFIFVSALASACSDNGGNVTIRGAGTTDGLSAVNPTQMMLKIYKVAVSASTNCSSPITLFSNDNPSYTNFLGNPTLGSGELADGTYPCVIFEISDNLKFIPETTEGVCTAGEEYLIDICRTDSTGSSTLVDGTVSTCTGSNDGGGRVIGEDRIAIYLSTGGTDEGQAFSPGDPITLGSAFVVAGSTRGTFVVNGMGQVDGSGVDCDMGAPNFSFQ